MRYTPQASLLTRICPGLGYFGYPILEAARAFPKLLQLLRRSSSCVRMDNTSFSNAIDR